MRSLLKILNFDFNRTTREQLLLFHLRRHVKNSGFVLHDGFQTPRNRCFSVFGTRDEALALVFDILLDLEQSSRTAFTTIVFYSFSTRSPPNNNRPLLSSKLWSSQLWTQLKQLYIEAWKRKDFNRVCTRDLAILVRRSNQLSYEATDV